MSYDTLEGDKFITPSDLTDLLEEATSDRDSRVEDAEDAEHPMEKSDMWREVAMWDNEHKESVERLKNFLDDINSEDILIRDDEMELYLHEQLRDMGDIDELPNYIVVDWDATYANLKQDYSEFAYAGVTYWQRRC